MPSGPDSDSNSLQIRCPQCGQRFKVGEELREKTVECGQCEHRFRIDDDVIIRVRKHYPGERTGSAHLERFSRIAGTTPPGSGPTGMPSGVTAPAHYETRKPEDFFPASPQRIFVAALGTLILIGTLVVLILSCLTPATSNEWTKEAKWAIAAIAAAAGTAMLLYGNRRSRGKAMIFALITSIAMFILPAIQLPAKKGTDTAESQTTPSVTTKSGDEEAPEKSFEELKEEIGYGPVEREIKALGDPQRVAALWLRDLAESQKIEVRDYILRETGAAPNSHIYPRNRFDSLFVLSDIKVPLSELETIVSNFGEVRRRLPDMRLLEVAIDESKFTEGPIDKLNNAKDPAFYELNVRELDSISLNRAERAVERLNRAEPLRFRADVTRRLLRLLEIGNETLQEKCVTGLMIWSDRPEASDTAVLRLAKQNYEAKKKLSEPYLRYLCTRKVTAFLPTMLEIWSKDPELNEDMLAHYGTSLEEPMIQIIKDKERPFRQRQSATRLLGRIGGEKSLPVLEAALQTTDPELKLLLERAMAEIKKR